LKSDNDSEPLFEDDEYALHPARTIGGGQTIESPSYLLWLSVILVCLSTIVTVLLPVTLSSYSSRPLSRSQVDGLPYPDQRLGLDRVASLIPSIARYEFSWPVKIARLNQKLKNSVYGNGVQVFISVEVSSLVDGCPASGSQCPEFTNPCLHTGLHDHAIPHPALGH
jgi:hypothetical protein